MKYYETLAYQKAIEHLTNNEYDIVLLDHDLGGLAYVPSGPDTGYAVAEWLENNPERIPGRVVIHSLNPVGAQNMNNAVKTAVQIPFLQLIQNIDAWLL